MTTTTDEPVVTNPISKDDTDWMTLIDFEEEITCDVPVECHLEVKWKETFRCCGVVYMICDFHKNMDQSNLKLDCYCKSCQAPKPGVTFIPL